MGEAEIIEDLLKFIQELIYGKNNLMYEEEVIWNTINNVDDKDIHRK